MANYHCVRWRFVLAGLLILLNPAGRSLRAQGPAPRPADAALYRQHCVKCHGADGSGSPMRDILPDIPSFAKAPWQARRTNAELLAGILDGVGKGMPAFRGKIDENQARGLVTQVRSFAPPPERKEKRKEPASPRNMDQEFRRLEIELRELQRQFHELSEASAQQSRSK
jgi:mono/diheme cytochrome c family protein